MQARARHDLGAEQLRPVAADHHVGAAADQAGDRPAEVDLPTLLHEELAELLGDRPVVADPGGGHPQRGDPAHVRLVRPHARLVELVVLDAVGLAAAGELFHPRQLGGLRGDHELAAHLVGQVVLAAERDGLRAPRDGQPRLQPTGGVVEPGVDDVGVAPRLVGGEARLALDHGHRAPRAGRGVGGGEADDAAADHHDLVPGGLRKRHPRVLPPARSLPPERT
jgi:hypothetical protein